MKYVTVFFDLEGWWDRPSKKRFDMEKIINRISRVLDKNEVKAVFNTCGVVVENFPDSIKMLYEKGHEISSHGYNHENFIHLQEMGELDRILKRTEDIMKKTIGERPIGIRSPWVIGNYKVYSTIERRGYRWVSNSGMFRTEILDNPIVNHSHKEMKRLFYDFLWSRHRKMPYKVVNELVEIPLIGSQDGELLGEMDPMQKTPEKLISFAEHSYKLQFDESKEIFNINFHPWLIGSMNRTKLLKNILDYMNQNEVEFVVAKKLIELRDI